MAFPFHFVYFGLAFWQGIVVYFIIRVVMPEGALEAWRNFAYVPVLGGDGDNAGQYCDPWDS
jgi:hypothetical protein